MPEHSARPSWKHTLWILALPCQPRQLHKPIPQVNLTIYLLLVLSLWFDPDWYSYLSSYKVTSLYIFLNGLALMFPSEYWFIYIFYVEQVFIFIRKFLSLFFIDSIPRGCGVWGCKVVWEGKHGSLSMSAKAVLPLWERVEATGWGGWGESDSEDEVMSKWGHLSLSAILLGLSERYMTTQFNSAWLPLYSKSLTIALETTLSSQMFGQPHCPEVLRFSSCPYCGIQCPNWIGSVSKHTERLRVADWHTFGPLDYLVREPSKRNKQTFLKPKVKDRKITDFKFRLQHNESYNLRYLTLQSLGISSQAGVFAHPFILHTFTEHLHADTV